MPADTAPDRRASGLSLRSRLALLLSVVAVFLLITVALQLVFQAQLADVRDDLIHRIGRSVETLGDVRAAALEEEAAVRGFALTGNPSFLAEAERSRVAGDAALQQLEARLADAPEHDDELDGLRAALADWRRATATVAPPEGSAQAPGGVLEDDVAQFEVLRTAMDRLDVELESDRAERLDDLDAAFERLLVMVAVLLVGLVILGGLSSVALSRLVLRPLLRLGRDAQRVAAGDLSHTVRGQGPPELVRLGADVEAMRARIVDELDQLAASRIDLEIRTGELERSNDDLEQFAYVASHDLQEPLRKVSGFCQLLEKRYADQLDDRAREYIFFATDGAKRMQVLINDLLAFSRVGRTSEVFTPVALNDVAAEAVEQMAGPIEESGATVDIGDLPVVAGDRRLLVAVFQNLIGNAVKFRRAEPPRVEIAATADGDEWRITVSDNGIGIDPAYGEQIFTIFKRLHSKADYEGTGIGLALCKKIVEYHGGRIWVEPHGRPGATLAFTLPAHPVAGESDSPDADPTDSDPDASLPDGEDRAQTTGRSDIDDAP